MYYHLILKETGEYHFEDTYDVLLWIQDRLDNPKNWEILPAWTQKGQERIQGKGINIYDQVKKHNI